MIIDELLENFKLSQYPTHLSDGYEIAKYIEEHSSSYVDIDMMEEYFRNKSAVLRMLPVSSLVQGNAETNIRNKKNEKKYSKMDIYGMPPIVVKDNEVIDGNHRLRIAIDKGVTEIPCYVVYEELQEHKLNEISLKKSLGAAALAAGIGYGATTTNSSTPIPSANVSFQQTKKLDNSNWINTDIQKVFTSNKQLTPEELKKNFILKVKPLIDQQNNQILSDRNFLISIQGRILSQQQKSRYSDISKKYGSSDIKELLNRVDIIPDTLALAQSALESGWGQSHFAKNGASLFGQRASRDSDNFASYSNYGQSIGSYMHNLNTNPAYKKFRAARYYMRKHGDDLNPVLLARTLVAYDSTGKAYTKKVSNMITHVIPKAEQLAMNEAASSRYFFHATKVNYLENIQKKGLLPNNNRETNWDGELGSTSTGKLFLAKTYDDAMYYGDILAKGDSSTMIFVLRVARNKVNDVIQDPESNSDVITTKPIAANLIEVKYGTRWIPLLNLDLDEIEYPDSYFYEGVQIDESIGTQDADNRLKQAGYVRIGIGQAGGAGHSIVYHKPNEPYVLKLFSTRDVGYTSFLQFCSKNNGDQHLPIFRGKLIKINDYFSAVRMEKLSPINNDEINNMINVAYGNREKNIEKYGSLAITTFKLIDFAENRGLELDFKRENIMKRGDVIVFVDPFWYDD